MDANWEPVQGANPPDSNDPAAAGVDWRTQLQPEARSRIVGRM
jgi:PAX-interacting protein 1